MSKYHVDCTKSDPKIPKKPSGPDLRLTSKPFCDCGRCVCQNCPDILKMLSITVTDTTCHFGTKIKSYDQIQVPEKSPPQPSSLLDVINQDRDCSCDVVARVVRDHVHMHIGLSERRNKMNEQEYSITNSPEESPSIGSAIDNGNESDNEIVKGSDNENPEYLRAVVLPNPSNTKGRKCKHCDK